MTMTTNNYFGFVHGTPQYTAATNAAYQTQPPGYAVPTNQPPNNNIGYPQRPNTGYEGYQGISQATPNSYTVSSPANVTPNYGYSGCYARNNTQVNVTPAQYDAPKTYYQQGNTPVNQTYASPVYQSKNSYTNSYANQSRPNNNQSKTNYGNGNYANGHPQPQVTVSSAYTPPVTNNTPPVTSNSNTTPTSNFCTVYPSQTNPPASNCIKGYMNTGNSQIKSDNSTWIGYKNPKSGSGLKGKTKVLPKTQELHYCEVCKISCAGPQTFREHLEGQRHKKKEALLKEGNTANASSTKGHSLKCELCDVVCTGADAYAAHLKGSKHQKVVKLHTKLAKPIPEVDLQSALAAAAAAKTPSATETKSDNVKKGFVQGGNLESVKVGKDISEDVNKCKPNNSVASAVVSSSNKSIVPVGLEYIEEIKNNNGKLLSFNCKLCDCKFNDPNAKDMHMKGRRHRLQYKKKVNPDLVVEVKPSGRRNRGIEERFLRKDDFFRRREMDGIFWNDRIVKDEKGYWEEMRRDELEWMNRNGGPPCAGFMPPPFGMRRPETIDDRHFNIKHHLIFPNDKYFIDIRNLISLVEKALKESCDLISEKRIAETVSESNDCGQKELTVDNDQKRIQGKGDPFQGLVQVGLLPKNLFLVDDKTIEYVILSSEYPTKSLLQSVFNAFQNVIDQHSKKTCSAFLNLDNGNFTVTFSQGRDINFVIYLTSPVVRSPKDVESQHPDDGLNEKHCLSALALVRRTRWFQARPGTNCSSVMVIRILRDLCQRNPTWTPLGDWAVELLVNRVVGGAALTGAEALRKFFEAVAGGILTDFGPGLADPCEREPTHAASHLTVQQSCDITASAQHALRLFAFRQIHKVLGINRIASNPERFGRKRRLDNPVDGSLDSDIGKKDKRENIVHA